MDTKPAHNLPEQPNALLGRDHELQAARRHLLSSDVRLLSVTGPPGVGKTRLAMAVAEDLLDSFPAGVWFVDLAPLHDPGLVESEIASTFGIAEHRGDTTFDKLVARLRGRGTLLFIDNFEGVLQAAPLIGRLLERTPGLKILTTSREPLRLRWERTILVRPLLLPDLTVHLDPSYLSSVPSVALFVQRASAVNGAFTLSVENAHIVADLCHRLDGLPLAIELAAAGASVLSPAEILKNMDDRFRMLGTGARDLPERHQTLKAAIDWSYESLSKEMMQFLRQLSIFKGGFSLKAAEFVTGCEAIGLDGLATLISLVEKSLVTRIQGPVDGPRFTFLESVRDYLLDRLRENGELDDVRRQHARYYLELAERTYAEMKGAHQRSWVELLESEHDNLRAALQWSLDTGEQSVGKRIAAAIWTSLWWLQGHVREGLRWLESFLREDATLPDVTHMRLLAGAGMLRAWLGDYEPGRALLMEALRISQERGEQDETTRVLAYLGWIFWVNGRTEEAVWLTHSIEACPPDVDPWELAYAFVSLGSLQYEAGLDQAATRSFAKSLEYLKFTEEKQQALIFAGHKLALLKSKSGDLPGASAQMITALDAAGNQKDPHVTAFCVDDAAQLAAQQLSKRQVLGRSDLEKLARVLGAVDQWRDTLSLLRTPREMRAYLETKEILQQQLGEDLYLRTWQEGRSMPVDPILRDATELVERTSQPVPQDTHALDVDGYAVTLSERERQVIGLLAEGLTNQEIGQRLFISGRTVRFHVTSIFNKLGATNRTQAVAIANRLGIL